MLFNEERLTELLELEPKEVAEFCGDYLNGETLTDHFEREEPFSRKEFCQYLGIGESTMTGWLKENRIPPMAKAAIMLPLVLPVLANEIRRLRKEATYPRILKSGGNYQIVAFREDEAGEAMGHVVADNLASLKTARILIAGFRALHLLNETDDVAVEYALLKCEGGDIPAFEEEVQKLRDEIRMCLLYAGDHEEWAKYAKIRKELEFSNTKEGRKASAESLESIFSNLDILQAAEAPKASEEDQNEH